MSDMFLSACKKAAVLAFPLFLGLALWQIVLSPFLDLHSDLDDEAGRAHALSQHYRALQSQEAEMKAELARLQEGSGSGELFYSSSNANAAATLLQQKLGELVAATGGQIRAVRVEIKPKTANYQPFAVNLTFAASSAGLAKLLFQLETLRPIVLVDHVFINAGPALLALQQSANTPDKDKRASEDQVLDVALTVSAFAAAKG